MLQLKTSCFQVLYSQIDLLLIDLYFGKPCFTLFWTFRKLLRLLLPVMNFQPSTLLFLLTKSWWTRFLCFALLLASKSFFAWTTFNLNPIFKFRIFLQGHSWRITWQVVHVCVVCETVWLVGGHKTIAGVECIAAHQSTAAERLVYEELRSIFDFGLWWQRFAVLF